MSQQHLYRIENIELDRAKCQVYAKLVSADGAMVISATLAHILSAIADRDLSVDGVTMNANGTVTLGIV